MIHLYVNHQTRQSAAETLNALTQKYGFLRHSLGGPWDILRTWDTFGAGTTSPPNAGVCRACIDHYSFMLEMVKVCGDAGSRLLWTIEALREYQHEATRRFPSSRTPSRRCPLPKGRPTQDSQQSCQATTCACRRTRPGILGGDHTFLNSYVLSHMAWFSASLSDEVGDDSKSRPSEVHVPAF